MKIVSDFARDAENKIPWKFLQGGVYEHYRMSISLEGRDDELDNVKQVTYILHPSFPNRERVTKARSTQFAITIWTYGEFNMTATVLFKDGTTRRLDHTVELDLPPDDEDYVDANYW